MPGSNKLPCLNKPFLVTFINRAFFYLIRAHAIYASHEYVTKYCSVCSPFKHFKVDMEARIGFKLGKVKGYNRYLFHSGFFKSSSYKSYIVCGSATATCLRHNDSSSVKVIFTGVKLIHDLSDNPK